MTSSLSTFPVLRPKDAIDADTAGTEAELNLEWARRQGGGNEAGPSATRAGQFVGLLFCAASSALVIWLVTLLF